MKRRFVEPTEFGKDLRDLVVSASAIEWMMIGLGLLVVALVVGLAIIGR